MTESKYTSKQDANEREYREEYRKWVDSLSPDQKLKIKKMGLDKPMVESRGVGLPEMDDSRVEDGEFNPFEAKMANNRPRREGADEVENSGLRGSAQFPAERASLQEALRRMISEVFGSERPNYTIGIIGVMLGIDDDIVRRVARRHRVSQSKVRAEAKRMGRRLGVMNGEDRKALRRVASDIAAQTNTKMSMEVLALVSGICYEGISETEIAVRYAKTRAAISKRCVDLCNRLSLPPSRGMKCEDSREKYAEAQNSIHLAEWEEECGSNA